MVPVITVTMMVLGLGLAAMYYAFRVRDLAHRERIRALDLGLPLPPTVTLRRTGNPFVMPLVLLGAGVAFTVMFLAFGMVEEEPLGFGLLFLFVGLGWLLALRLNRDNRRRAEEQAQEENRLYAETIQRVAGPAAENGGETESPVPRPESEEF